VQGSEGFVERSAEVGELIEGGGFDAAGVEVTDDQAVAFGTAEGVSAHLVRHAVEGIIEVLVAAAAISEFGEHRQSPPPGKEHNEGAGVLGRSTQAATAVRGTSRDRPSSVS